MWDFWDSRCETIALIPPFSKTNKQTNKPSRTTATPPDGDRRRKPAAFVAVSYWRRRRCLYLNREIISVKLQNLLLSIEAFGIEDTFMRPSHQTKGDIRIYSLRPESCDKQFIQPARWTWSVLLDCQESCSLQYLPWLERAVCAPDVVMNIQ